jgi:hypothetical protein
MPPYPQCEGPNFSASGTKLRDDSVPCRRHGTLIRLDRNRYRADQLRAEIGTGVWLLTPPKPEVSNGPDGAGDGLELLVNKANGRPFRLMAGPCLVASCP